MNKLVIEQKKIKGCEDSFWYDGLIASIGNYRLIATGNVRIDTKNGDCAYSGGKFRDYKFRKKVINDKTLENYVGQNYDENYYWVNNNWFEVVYAREIINGLPYIDYCDILEVVEYDYTRAIKMLKQYATEDSYNKK